MELTKHLQNQGYDLINGPIRNQKLLQLWLKKPLNEIEEMYRNLSDAFNCQLQIPVETDPSMQIDASMKNQYDFTTGATALNNTLQAIGMKGLNLEANIKGGRSVTISYDNASSEIAAIGPVTDYLSQAQFKTNNPVMQKEFDRNNVILITGILVARNLVVEIAADHQIDSNIAGTLSSAAEGKINVSQSSANTLNMTAQSDTVFPIAIKANRLQYHQGKFAGIKAVSDNRNWF